jgi:hypothetical protein
LLLSLLLAAPGEPPVLLDPDAAKAKARDALAAGARPAERRRLAETALLAGDPWLGLELLEGTPKAPCKPGTVGDDCADVRLVRLELDAHAAAGDVGVARSLLPVLEAERGWATHARRRDVEIAQAESGRALSNFGTVLFSLSFALLLVGARRALLRPGLEALLVVAAAAVATLIAGALSRALGPVAGVLFFAAAGITHAAMAARRRQEPGPRGRLLLLGLSLLAITGVALAILAPLPMYFLERAVFLRGG